MLESLVASLLNRFLGNYVSNLNYDQLNIGIWKGEANLRNLKLRREALDKLNLPIDVVEGYLGELTLSIPWSNLKGKPVKVFIENVYLLAVPKNEAMTSAKDEEERAQALKQRRLTNAEILETSRKQKEQPADQQADGSGDGFLSQLTTKIVDNLQVSIKNIHIRFEDNLSDPGHPYAAGITLKELSAVSTDGEWNPTFISEATDTIHKLATLQSLSVYWNTDSRSLAGMSHEEASRVYTDLIPDDSKHIKEHQYILKPVSGTGKVKLNKIYGPEVAKTDVTLLFEELGIGLDDHQYRDAILLVDLFHDNLKKQKYLKFRPERGTTPKSDPKAYFKFAANAVLSEIHERNYKWTWDHFKKRRDQRLAYIDCYVASKMNKATPEQTKQLEQLEWDLSFDDIRFYRSLSKSKMKREKIKIEQEKKKTENQGWFSSWWSGSSQANKGEAANGEEEDPLVMTEEQKKELYDAIDYDEEKAAISAAVDMPKDTKKFLLSTKLNRGSLTLRRHSHTAETQDLASLVFDTVTVDVIQYIESLKISTSLGDLQLYDGLTPNTLYPQLIGVKKKDQENASLVEVKSITSSDEAPSLPGHASPFFSASFEHKPLNHVADNAISVTMRHLEIIYNPVIVQGVLRFFKPPENKAESVNALLEVAGDTLESFKQQTRAGLEYALEKHTTFALYVDMDAPIFIIPESCTEERSPAMIVDAGHIQVDSDLANQELISEFKRKDSSREYTNEDYRKLENLMYDKFKVQLTQTKLLIGNDVQECLAQQQGKKEGQAHVIQRIDMEFLVELCILQGATQFTKFKVSGHLPLLSVDLSNTKYKTLMRMIDLILDSISTNDPSQPALPAPQYQAQEKPKNILAERLWGNSQHDIYVSDTETESLADSTFSDSSRPPTRQWQHESEPTSASSSVMVSSMKFEQEDFRFMFKVDKVQATVHETSQNDPNVDILLCELNLDTFDLDFVSRPHDMLVNVSLKSLNVVDKMEHGNEFGYLVTSDYVDESDLNKRSTKDLVHVKYMQVKKDHPLYEERYQGFDQTVEITLSTLNIIVTRSSILTLYNFVLSTFTAPPAESEDTEGESEVQAGQLSEATTGSDVASQQSQANESSNTIKVTIHMDSLDLILNDDGKRLGTGVLSYGDLEVLLYPNTLKVDGKFGNFTLTDDTDGARKYDLEHGMSNVYILDIAGEELANFTYETYDPKAEAFPGYDSRFLLRMGALQFKFLDSAKPILDFLSEFLEMKTVYDAAREAAYERAQQMQNTDSRMHFDIAIKSPVVICPVGPSTDTITAHLGEIRAINEFGSVKRRKLGDLDSAPCELSVSRIRCGLHSIGLRSRTTVVEDESERERELPIIDNLDMTFAIESPEKPAPEWGPATRIDGHVSDIRMALTEHQYKSLLEVYNKFMATFMAGGDEEDEEEHVSSDQTSSASARNSQVSRPSKQKQPQSQEPSKPSEKAMVSIEMTMDVRTICLEILAGPDLDLKDWHKQRLARLAFNETAMKMQNMSDGAMLLEVSMQSMTFVDTRADSASQFKEIMSASHLSGPQLQVSLTMPGRQQPQIMTMAVTVDKPKVVLSLDYLFHLRDFFMSPWAEEQTTAAQKYAQSQRERLEPSSSGKPQNKPSKGTRSNLSQKQQQQQQQAVQQKGQEEPMQMHYTVNVVDVQLICLAKPESTASEALIFSLNHLTLRQDKDLKCRVERIGMLLCRMDNQDESALPFIEEFDVDVAMETSSALPGYSVSVIKIDVKPLVVRLSYHDAMLVLEVFNKVMELTGGGGDNTNPPSPRTIDDDEENQDQPVDGQSQLQGQQQQEQQQQQQQQKVEPYIVMSKESLIANVQGLQFILIEDLHDLPFIDTNLQPFEVKVSDWSRALSADVYFTLSASSFNFRNSHWEPIIEPWGFGVRVSQDAATKSMKIALKSQELLYLDVTHAFLSTLMTISETMNEVQPLPASAQKQIRPYMLRNLTGYDMRFWNMSDDADGLADTEMYVLKNLDELPWTFRDWKRRRQRSNLGKNMVGVQVEAFDWEILQHIPLDQEGQFAYRMRPDIKGVSHRLTVDIELKNHVKQVTFRSGIMIKNETDRPFELCIQNAKGTKRYVKWTIAPENELSIPIAMTYNAWVTVRPSDEYGWSSPPLHWSDVIHPRGPKYVTCTHTNDSQDVPHIFQVHGLFDKRSPVVRRYPFMTMQFGAPIEIENLLPFGFDYKLVDRNSGKIFTGVVEKHGVAYLNGLKSTDSVTMCITIHGGMYDESSYTDIEPDEGETTKPKPIYARDKNDNTLCLRMNAARLGKTNGALWINIYSPYLILNKTGLPLLLRSRTSHRQSKHPIFPIPDFEHSEQISPVLFSFPELDRRNRVQLSANDSKWSEALTFEAVGSAQDIVLPLHEGNHEMHVGVRVEEGTGTYHLTKIVTLSPRFVLRNNLDRPLQFCEFGDTDYRTTIKAHEKLSIYRLTKSPVRWLCLQNEDEEVASWSSPFDIQQIGITHIKLYEGYGNRPTLVRVTVTLKDAAVFIFLDEEDKWPYKIYNGSSIPITFYQRASALEEYHLKDKQKKALPESQHFTLEPQSEMSYSWCMPVAHDRRLVLEVNNKRYNVDFQAIGSQVPFQYKKGSRRTNMEDAGILSIDIKARNSALVLELSDFTLEDSLYRIKSSAASTIASSSREGSVRDLFETVEMEVVVNFELDIELAGIGISIVNRHVQEMAFATIKGIDIKYADSNLYQSMRASFQWLQVDNQFHGCVYPILFFPSTLPKSTSEQNTHPTLHIALDRHKDEAHGVYYFKLFSILLQEMTFEMDEDFLYGLLEFADMTASPETSLTDDSQLLGKEITEPQQEQTPAMYYFEEFYIQPMRLNLSFVRTERVNAVAADTEATRSPIRYIFDVFTMTIGNINDAPIKLNALMVENMLVSWDDMYNRIWLHYQDQIIFQVHKVLGSADFIGNPVGLFSSLSSGFGELFYEPYQGFIMSDRPQDLGIGIARGVGGFMKKSVFGFSDSMSRFTGSIGKGLSAATMDKKYQDRRRINLTRNKPRHAMYGVTQGVTYLGTSVASGVAGLVKRPMEGAKQDGVAGFAGGVGRGLVGVVTKPLVGMFDLANNITTGVRETTMVFDPNDIARERLPRFVGMDGILRSFAQRESLGQLWLKELDGGKFFYDNYLAHVAVQSDEVVTLLTWQRVLLIHTKKLDVEWHIPLENVESVDTSPEGILVHVKSPVSTTVIPIEEETSRRWFTQQIEETLKQRQEERERQ